MPTMNSQIRDAASWLEKYHRYTNYISAAMLYLKDNYLLEAELSPEHIKPRILGHWGTVPGLNLIYGGINHLIKKHKQESMLIVGPGHGAPAILSGIWLEGTLLDFDEKATVDRQGMEYIIKQFSWPKGYPSHTFPGLPGSIHEGGELGYSLGTAYGTVLDNPELLTICIVGDGEAETGPLAAAWQANKFINPKTDGVVLPILHLNGYRISGPTFFGTMSDEEIRDYFYGLSYEPIIIDQYKSENIYADFLISLEDAYAKIQNTRTMWDSGEKTMWPLIILRTKKGWTGPKYNGDLRIEDNNLSHGIPLKNPKKDKSELKLLNDWLSSYRIKELIKISGSPKEEVTEYLAEGKLRLGATKYANGGILRRELNLPDLADHELDVNQRGFREESRMEQFGQYIRDIYDLNTGNRNFRLFSPDESESNLLEAPLVETDRGYLWPVRPHDHNISPSGRVVEILSEHVLQEMMTGYLLTGRHAVLVSYEAFLGIVTNQVEQYIKFLKQSTEFKWRKPVSGMNLIATSTVWRQEHNGFSHQNPTLINALLTKKPEYVNIYFPSDVNTLLVTLDECFKSKNCVNLIIACKRELPQWLKLSEAKEHVKKGISIWHFSDSTHEDDIPDVVLASAGDYQTLETLAAVQILNDLIPEIKIRYINVNELTSKGFGRLHEAVDTEKEFIEYFTDDRDVIFNFHGYPAAIKQITWGHEVASRMKVLGYIEEGSTTTPFDMQVVNKASRFHVCMEAIKSAAKFNKMVREREAELLDYFETKLATHEKYIVENGDDMPEVKHVDFKLG